LILQLGIGVFLELKKIVEFYKNVEFSNPVSKTALSIWVPSFFTDKNSKKKAQSRKLSGHKEKKLC